MIEMSSRFHFNKRALLSDYKPMLRMLLGLSQSGGCEGFLVIVNDVL